MATDAQLRLLNDTLANVPLSGAYDLSVFVEGHCYACRGGAGRGLHVQVLDAASCSEASEARTCVTADTFETLARAGRAGQVGILQLLASRKLRVEGDVAQLQALREELAPHTAALQEAMARARDMSSFGGGSQATGEAARWVPNEAVSACMEAHCGRPFSVLTRRHHCRACGGVFCNSCAPVPAGNSAVQLPGVRSQARVCVGCRQSVLSRVSGVSTPAVGTLPPPVRPLAGAAPPQPATAPPAVGPDGLSGTTPGEGLLPSGSSDMDAAKVLLEWTVERELRALRFQSRCFLLVLCSLAVALLGRYLPGPVALLALARAAPRGVQAVVVIIAAAGLWHLRLFYRLAQVAWICAVLAYSIIRTARQARGRPAAAEKAIWEMAHRIHARFLLDAVTELSGFYVKVAQTLSIQAAIPEPFHLELSKLQDSMPAEPHEEVERTLAEEFGKDWRRLVRLHPGPPLGSATIAQVHRATLRVAGPDGIEKEVEGVVKVQHRKMKGNLAVDMYAARMLAAMMGYVSPNLFEDFADIIREVAALTKAELDFNHEAENQRLAREAVLAAGVDIVIPVVFPKLVTRRVLGMEYIDGVRMSDFAREASTEDRTKAVRGLIEFFAFSFTQAGIFNSDPHPGNLLVTKDSRLCVLDWGQARRLSQGEMEAFSMIFVAASLHDPFLLVKAGARIGQHFQEYAAVSMLPGLRFLMRDSRPLQMSKDEMVSLEKMFSRFPAELQNVKGDSKGILQGPLLPLSKTVDLLNNVSTRFAVSLSLLQVFTARGYELLLRSSHLGGEEAPHIQQAKVGFILHPAVPASLPAPRALSPLDAALRDILLKAHGRGGLLGAQVVALDVATGAVLADVAVGHTSYLRACPVTRATPFNVGELSKLPLALAVLKLVDAGKLRLGTTLGELWPAAKALREVTLEQVLSHTSGVVQVFPKGVPTLGKLADLSWMLKHIETSGLGPLLAPGSKQQYHYLTFGWLLAAALKGAGQDVAALQSSLMPDLALKRDAVQSTLGASEVADLTREMDSFSIEEVALMFETVNNFLDILERAKGYQATLEERADGEVFFGLHGFSQWLLPPALSEPAVASGTLLGAAAYGTAGSVARLMQRLAKGEIVRPETLQDMRKSRKVASAGPVRLPRELRSHQESEWGLGVQLLSVPGAAPSDERPYGHSAASGSLAAVVPGRRPVALALLLNRTDGWERGVPQAVLQSVTRYAAGGDGSLRA